MLRSGGAHSDRTEVLLGGARQPCAPRRLSWPLAALVIIGLSTTLWLGLGTLVLQLIG